MQTRVIDNELHRLEIIDGILFAQYKPNIPLIDMTMARKLVRDRLELIDGTPYPICGDISNMSKVADDARVFLGQPEAIVGITALAIIQKSTIQNLLANFYLKVNKPEIPTRLFSSKEKATLWLEPYKVKNLN